MNVVRRRVVPKHFCRSQAICGDFASVHQLQWDLVPQHLRLTLFVLSLHWLTQRWINLVMKNQCGEKRPFGDPKTVANYSRNPIQLAATE